MKYKRSIALIGACAIVSASVVAPFSFAFSSVVSDYTTDEMMQQNFSVFFDRFGYEDNQNRQLINDTKNINHVRYMSVSSFKITKIWDIYFGISSGYINDNGAFSFRYSWKATTQGHDYGDNSYTTDTVTFDYSGGTGLLSKNSLTIDTTLRYFWDFNKTSLSNGNYIIAVDISKYDEVNTLEYSQKRPQFKNNNVWSDNPISTYKDIVIPPEPTSVAEPYTDSAPGFPNLPNDWVNGGGDVDIKIDLPDIDFNLPDLPDYTLPSAPTIPDQFQTGISTVFGKIWDIVVQSGLVWLVVFSLTCSLIVYILSR